MSRHIEGNHARVAFATRYGSLRSYLFRDDVKPLQIHKQQIQRLPLVPKGLLKLVAFKLFAQPSTSRDVLGCSLLVYGLGARTCISFFTSLTPLTSLVSCSARALSASFGTTPVRYTVSRTVLTMT